MRLNSAMALRAEWVGIGLGLAVGLGSGLVYVWPAPSAPVAHVSTEKPPLQHTVTAQQKQPVKQDVDRNTSYPDSAPVLTAQLDAPVPIPAIVPPAVTPVPAPLPVMASRTDAPLVAIVLDDMGGNARLSQQALALPLDITFAFLPYPHATPRLAADARAMGRDVILHMPMQPSGGDHPGPDALRPDAPAADNVRHFTAALARLPNVDTFNNHMGSRMTVDAAALQPIMATAAARGLRFLDSRTAGRSVALAVARQAGVQALGRDVFLDHVIDERTIRAQLDAAEAVARKRGYAVAIGHPHPQTLSALSDWAEGAVARGVRIGTLSMAFERAGYDRAQPAPLLVAEAALLGADTVPQSVQN